MPGEKSKVECRWSWFAKGLLACDIMRKGKMIVRCIGDQVEGRETHIVELLGWKLLDGFNLKF